MTLNDLKCICGYKNIYVRRHYTVQTFALYKLPRYYSVKTETWHYIVILKQFEYIWIYGGECTFEKDLDHIIFVQDIDPQILELEV